MSPASVNPAVTDKIVFLLEEYSMKALLEGFLPRFFPDCRFQYVVHEGRSDLEKSIPRKLRAWREPGVRFLILCDNDGRDCYRAKRHLLELCRESGRQSTVVRLACQELEAWYFGAPDALAEAFGRDDLRKLSAKARYRDPDAIAQPARVLGDLVESFQKVSGARRMARLLTRENSSRSFQVLLAGIERLSREGARASKKEREY